MSAWIVSKNHIDALVQALAEGEIVVNIYPTEIGRTLWKENLLSIWARYPDTEKTDDNYPGPYGFRAIDTETYVYTRPAERLSYGSLLKQAHCYSYQTCEHDGWETSQAKKWIDTLRRGLERGGHADGSEYAAAPWGID